MTRLRSTIIILFTFIFVVYSTESLAGGCFSRECGVRLISILSDKNIHSELTIDLNMNSLLDEIEIDMPELQMSESPLSRQQLEEQILGASDFEAVYSARNADSYEQASLILAGVPIQARHYTLGAYRYKQSQGYYTEESDSVDKLQQALEHFRSAARYQFQVDHYRMMSEYMVAMCLFRLWQKNGALIEAVDAEKRYVEFIAQAAPSYSDPLGLVPAAMGYAARLAAEQGKYERAVELYIGQGRGRTSGYYDQGSMVWLARRILDLADQQRVEVLRSSKVLHFMIAYSVSSRTPTELLDFVEEYGSLGIANESVGYLAFLEGEFDIARRYLESADPSANRSWLLGKLLARESRFEEALQQYRSALRLADPGENFGQLFREEGVLLYSLGRYYDAARVFVHERFGSPIAFEYLARRVLTLDELKRLLSSHSDPENVPEAAVFRLFQLGDPGRAARYLPEGGVRRSFIELDFALRDLDSTAPNQLDEHLQQVFGLLDQMGVWGGREYWNTAPLLEQERARIKKAAADVNQSWALGPARFKANLINKALPRSVGNKDTLNRLLCDLSGLILASGRDASPAESRMIWHQYLPEVNYLVFESAGQEEPCGG